MAHYVKVRNEKYFNKVENNLKEDIVKTKIDIKNL